MPEVMDDIGNNSLNVKDFKLDEVLFNSAEKRTIALLGKFPSSETHQAIIIMGKVEFAEVDFTTSDRQKSLLAHTDLETKEINDIYSDYIGSVDSGFNS